MFQLVVRQRGLLEQDARWYFQQLIIAIDYCHKMVSKTSPCRQYCSTGMHPTGAAQGFAWHLLISDLYDFLQDLDDAW